MLARDRVGVRPLYYCVHRGQLVFASEVKAIFAAAPSFPRAFDPVGLDQTLTFWTAIAPRTVFAGVHELPPGHLRIYDRDGVRERAYWTPQYPADFGGSLDEATEAVRARYGYRRSSSLGRAVDCGARAQKRRIAPSRNRS